MKNSDPKHIVRSILERYSKYKLSLSERGLLESISSEVADELSRNFVIESKHSWAKSVRKPKQNQNDS